MKLPLQCLLWAATHSDRFQDVRFLVQFPVGIRHYGTHDLGGSYKQHELSITVRPVVDVLIPYRVQQDYAKAIGLDPDWDIPF